MNLDSVMEEPVGILDYDWMTQGLGKPGGVDVSGIKNPNNIRPELEVQWGGGTGDILNDRPAGKVDRYFGNPPESAGESIVLFARDQMNRGRSASEIRRMVRGKYSSDVVAQVANELEEQLNLDGLVGCVALDARGYKSCKHAMRSASSNPRKRFISMVIGCGCGDAVHTPVATSEMGDPDQVGIDGFIASSNNHRVATVSRCASTSLRRMVKAELDDKWVSDTLIELRGTEGLPDSVAEKVAERKCSNVAKVMMAFRWLEKKGSQKPAKQRVVAEKVEIAPMEVEVAKEVRNDPVPVNVGVHYPDVPVEEYIPIGPQLDVEPCEPTHVAPVALDEEFVPDGSLDIDPRSRADEIDFADFGDEPEIDMTPELSGLWENTDEVDLETESTPEPELNVERGGSFEW